MRVAVVGDGLAALRAAFALATAPGVRVTLIAVRQPTANGSAAAAAADEPKPECEDGGAPYARVPVAE